MSQRVDFRLPEDDERLLSQVRRFACEQLRPIVVDSDRQGHMPEALWATAFELGLLGALIPSRSGGGGLSSLQHALVAECLAQECTGLQAALLGNSLATHALALTPNGELRDRCFARLTTAPYVLAFALTEANAGSDVAALRTRCSPRGGGWHLRGSKAWVTNAEVADAFVVFATTDTSKRHAGLAAFVVDRATTGLSVGPAEDKLGQRACSSASVTLDGVVVSEGQLLAEPGCGFALAMDVLERSRPDIGAMATGLMARCLSESLDYAQGRETFGQAIAQHQLVQRMLANMAIATEASRLLYQKAAWLVDAGGTESLSSHAKAYGADNAIQVASDAVQIFGANGYSRSYPVEKLLRDAKVLQIFEGTSEIQRLLIARRLLRSQ